MQQRTGTKEDATLNTQDNVKKTHDRNSTLVKIDEIEGTPFKMVTIEGKHFIALGDHRITEPTDSKEETLEKLEKEKWNITLQVIIIVNQMTERAINAVEEIKKATRAEGGGQQTI